MKLRSVLLCLLLLAAFTGYAQDDEECMFCHGDPELGENYIDLERYEAGIHAPMGCISCHMDIEETPHDSPLEPVDCGGCHLEAEEYMEGVHGQSRGNGSDDPASCADCHGVHGIRPSDDSLSFTHPTKLPQTCGKCHQNVDLAKQYLMPVIDPEGGYLRGVHAKAILEDGNFDAASCTDCHGAHKTLPSQDPESPIYRANIPATCGECHADTLAEYADSIHGQALEAGVKDAPTCIDCHGEHGITPHDVDLSPVSREMVSESTCPQCHNNADMMARYGIEAQHEATYMDSYHGMSGKAGGNVEASCSSCHGVHDIKRMDNPESRVHPDNVVETCRQCHEGANENFAASKVHMVASGGERTIQWWVRTIYIWLITLTLGGMAFHNGLFLLRRAVMKYRAEKASNPETYKRFGKAQVIGHMVLAVSFLVLVASGFALRYPDALWARILFWGDTGLEVRDLIHRIAAVGLIAVTVANLIAVIISRKAREDVWAFVITPQDIKDVFANFAYVVGLRKKGPRFDRYSYAEKAEYWGLWWGSLVMIVTGFCMWFPEVFMGYFSKTWLDVAALIHYYEAWLAAGVIVIWHWYHIAFEPSQYPINWSWLTGHITEKEFKHHHPLEWERQMGTPAEDSDSEDE